MNDTINKAIAWVKANMMIAVFIGIAVIFLFFGSQVKRLLFGRRRIRHRRPAAISRTSTRRRTRTMRRPLPRSVGMHRASGKGYPKVGGGYIPFKRNKNGTVKNAKFVAGTVAARNHMAKMRRNR